MLVKVNEFLEYNRSEIFAGGDGCFNGTYKGKPVVVKRTLLTTIKAITSSEDLSRIMHPNIALLLHVHVTKDNDFRFDAVEKYAASLDSRFFENSNPDKYKGPMPSNEQVLLQLASGLGYLHSLNILHGDIKPENILISSTEPVKMKWTGFGFRQSNDSYSLSVSGLQLGSTKWWPPEMHDDGKNASEAGEIFSAGCVFLYFLSGGVHPFGSPAEIARNVRNGNAVNLIGPNDSDLSITHFAFLSNMIQKNPKERITLWEVIRHLKIKQLPDLKNCPMLQYLERGRMRKRKIDSNEKYSFGLHLSKSDGVVVKKIPKNDFSAIEILKLTKLNHWNIVRIFDYYDEDSSYKYFRMEFCSASLDHLFEGDPKKYNIDSMPSLDQVFLQIANGLQYIHEKDLVHGSIKPSNVLINSNENPQIKLADFGLIETRWDHVINSSSAVSVSGFQSEHYWLAPELLNAANRGDSVKPTKESDIFAAGKVFFYYYYQFLIQKLKTISDGTRQGTREPDFKKLSKSPMKLIEKMTLEDQNTRYRLSKVISNVSSFKEMQKPEQKHSKSGAFQFLRNHILGEGEYGIVFLGFWNGSIAVVKRIEIKPKSEIVIQREQQLKELNNINVVKFYESESDGDFRYIAMEKCLTSLEDYCKKVPQLFHGVIPMPSDKEVLLQMARGLQYIHSQELIHRDVKPGNILISGDNPAVIKWTDFGVSKKVKNKDGEPWTFRQGTPGWRAREVLLSDNKTLIVGEKNDIFSLGCVFFFFLTPAIHPFGSKQDRENNIISQIEPIISITEQLTARKHSAFAPIILGMIKSNQNSRTKLLKVIENLNAVVIEP